MVDLSVLVVTYNSAAFVGECLDSVSATVGGHSFEVVVADNASTDGVVELLARSYPSARVIEMGANTGFACANNAALAVSSGRHVLLLNGDAVVQPGALDAMVDFLDAHPECGAVAPRLLNTDGSDQGTARSFPTPAAAVFGRRSPLTRLFPRNRWSSRYLSGRTEQGRSPFEVDWVSGACVAVPRRVVAEVGGLDEGFFMHWEDADWCRRIRNAGYRVHTLPEAEVVHHEGKSRQGWPARQVLHFHRGAYRYYTKHHTGGPWSLRRPIAAAALASRAGLILLRDAGARKVRRPAVAAPYPPQPAGT